MSDIREGLDQIAIIGMAARFPGAPDIDAFWENLQQGREGIGSFSDDELTEAGVSPALLRQDNYVRAKGALDGADQFDAGFFGYSPREAQIMDPQQRVFLECAWAALESAGCDPREFGGRIAVFGGVGLNTYLLRNVLANQRIFESVGEYQTLLASDKDFLSTRVAYKLGLTGPALTVQTACSTSLMAVHLACQSLLNGECDVALAGGVAVSSPLKSGYAYEAGGILSADGHCRPFDADAGGTVPGNGAGIVVLRRLADARDHGDAVDAIILGSAVNNDGSLKVGFTAPSVDGQADVISEALAVADVTADTIGYVETHGTGTVLGDPIEIAALTRAFRADTQQTGYCPIGSVKSNVGHLDAAAGVAALIKTTLMLRHEAIVPSLHFTRPNPELGLETSPFFVNSELRPWPRRDTPRRAGVSSFGIGGTNVHVVLEEAPPEKARVNGAPLDAGPAGSVLLLPLSAKTPEAVAQGAQRLADYLDQHPDAELGDVAYTLTRRRRAFEHRASVVGRDTGEAVAALRAVRAAGVVAAPEKDAAVAFLFPGQGAQYVGMARDLYEQEPVFAAELDRCAALFAAHLGLDLRELLFAPPDQAEVAAAKLAQTQITQPVMFVVEYALARLWSSWGVRPSAMVGHSIGEYVAACLAGVFSLEDAAALVAARGRLVQAMPRGSMLTVFLPEAEVAKWLDGDLCLAAVNSTALSVVSGPAEAVTELEQRLQDAGISCRLLHTSHAFHSPSMDGAIEPLIAAVRTVALHPPRIPFCSDVTGTWITDEQATSPEYWGSHLRAPVRFGDCVERLLGDPSLVLVEVGPGHTLGSFVREHRAWHDGRTVVGSLRHPKEKADDRVYLLRSLGRLWSAGVQVDWSALDAGGDHRVLRLPTYAFQWQRYWVEPDAVAPGQLAPGQPAPGQPAGGIAAASVDDWFYTPGWKRLPLQGERVDNAADALWVVLGDDTGLRRALAARLEKAGAAVFQAGLGDDFAAVGNRSWSLEPASREHFAGLVKLADAENPRAIRFVHLFSLGCEPADILDEAQLNRARRLGFDSLLALAQGIDDAGPSAPVAIDVLCRGLRSVTGEERLQPENATLAGVCTVIPQELSDVTCRTLDISGADPQAPSDEVTAAVYAVLTRPAQPAQDRDLALRGRYWWCRDFDAAALGTTPDGGPRLRDGGVYLITGGLGGVGLALADYIADHADSPVLALLSRSEFPAEQAWAQWLDAHTDQDVTSARIRRLLALRERGARIAVRQGDVADAAQTAAHVRELRDHFGGLSGVIHAAGLPATGMITTKSVQDAERAFAAKTVGTLALDRACADDDLDFFLLCSSATAVLGGPGQSDYCGANAFLDAFAQWKNQNGGGPVTAVAWGTWDGVGMAAGLRSLRPGEPAEEPAGEPTGHPMLRRVKTPAGTWTYATSFSTATSWIVDDHRLMGHGLIPGSAYLELVRGALAEQAGEREIVLHDVLFMTPVVVPDGQTRTVYTTIEERDGQLIFTIRSRVAGGASWRQHASGSATFADRGPDTVRDLDEVLARCEVTEVIDTEEEIRRRFRVDRFAKGAGPLEFGFGPRWQVLRKIQTGGRRMLATLRLDDAFLADLDAFALHPALLDMAGGVFRLHAPDRYYLPLTYRRVRVVHGLTSTVYCSVEIKDSGGSSGETLTCDIELLDPEGRLLVQITDFSIKRINDVSALVGQVKQAVADAERDAAADAGDSRSPAGALSTLSEGMSERDGQAAFGAILSAASLPSQVVVCPRDFAGLRGLARSITPSLLIQEIEQLAPPSGMQPRPELDTPYVAPVTDEEKGIAAVWQEVLGIEPVGVNDDFFALGGHSLAAVQIGTKIRSRLHVELDLRHFFNAPTVARTAILLTGGQSVPGADDVIEVVSREQSDEELADEQLADEQLADLDALSDDEVEARLQEMLAQERKDTDEG